MLMEKSPEKRYVKIDHQSCSVCKYTLHTEWELCSFCECEVPIADNSIYRIHARASSSNKCGVIQACLYQAKVLNNLKEDVVSFLSWLATQPGKLHNDSEPNINSNCILCLICDSFYQNDGNCLQIRKLFSCQKVSILKAAANSFSLSKLFVY